MTKLWRAIEESPLLMDVKDVWRERLGMEFEPLSRFLEATNIVATRLPGRTPWSSFKVVVNDDSFVAFCESTGESREVPRADVICHQLNSSKLAAELNAALSLGESRNGSTVVAESGSWVTCRWNFSRGRSTCRCTLRAT